MLKLLTFFREKLQKQMEHQTYNYGNKSYLVKSYLDKENRKIISKLPQST